jgi:signal transduction histidine kinase/ligand-binding sensor domain-containing protein/DNA-binding response OmpR family regulator
MNEVLVYVKKSTFLLLLFGINFCFSQSQIVFKRLDQSHGLSSARIMSIEKEKNGYVWVGTDNGLNRYDGKDVKIFNKKNSTISSNNITDVLLDSKGRIWVATLGGGLNLYDPVLNIFKSYKYDSSDKNSLISNQVNTLFEDSKGLLWLGTDRGLCFFDDYTSQFRSVPIRNSGEKYENISVTSICEDINGTLWVGSFGGGISKLSFEDKSLYAIQANSGVFADFIHTLIQLNSRTLLVGTSGAGLLKFDLKTLKYVPFFNESDPINKQIKIIRELHKDRQGTLWVGTDGKGILKIENPNSNSPKVINYKNSPQLNSSISGNAVYKIFEDENSNIWIGTSWNGISILNTKLKHEFLYSDIVGEKTEPVLSIYKNKDKLFLGLDGGGMTVFDNQKNKVDYFKKEQNNAIFGDYVQCIIESKKGDFWFGTYANGLIYYNSSTKKTIQYKHLSEDVTSISFNDIRSIIEEDSGNLWISSWGGGLNYFDNVNKNFTSYREDRNNTGSISSDIVIALEKDNDYLWLATYGGGLDRFHIPSKKIKHYTHHQNDSTSLGSDNILSVLKDSRENLWVGTFGAGINRLDKNKDVFNRFDSQIELSDKTINAIVEDAHGTIWFSTQSIIYSYDYKLDKFTSFPNLKGEYRINSVSKDALGKLYFGTKKGLVKFDPLKMKHEEVTPIVKITSFKLFNKELEIGEGEIISKSTQFLEEIVLKHDMNVFTFEFGALQFPFSKECEYAIQLMNFDKNWRFIKKERSATYTNLSHGSYEFRVKSRERGSDWGTGYTSINVVVLKPFWLEWWAYFLYGVLIVFIFYLFRKYVLTWEQMKTNLKLEKITHEKDNELYNSKQQFFTNISHEIRTPVTLILGSINRLLSTDTFIDAEASNSVNTLQKNSKQLLQLVNELLDFRKLEYNEIRLKVTQNDCVDFCNEIYLSFTELALQKNITFEFEFSNPKIEVWFDTIQMEKVIYNLLTNAFKFSQNGGLVQFTVTADENSVQLTLKDNGVGIANKQLSKIFNRFYQTKESHNSNGSGFGLGLTISKEIIELHHGTIKVTSKKGQGTTFIIDLQKGNEHFKAKEIVSDEGTREMIEDYAVDVSQSSDKQEPQFSKNRIEVKAKTQTILVVEDNPEIRAYMVSFLRDEFKVLEAENGKVALGVTYQESPDLIVSDVMMPEMDGITLTRTLKRAIQTSHIPIILLTAKTSFVNQMEGFDVGADAYVTKPFNELLLISRIHNILHNRSLLHKAFVSEDIVVIDSLEINKNDQEFLEKIVSLIETYLESEDLNANFISSELGMSHSVVYKKLKSITGMTFIDFVRDYKLKKAKVLLQAGGISVAEVSYKVGYSDRKYFSKLFKKRFGVAPSVYLK